MDKDALMFEIMTFQKLSTCHGLLSTLSSIYDPLGLVSVNPLILEGRELMQKLCKNEFMRGEEMGMHGSSGFIVFKN